MTLIVGILCKDGVVVASDSAATLGTGALGVHPTIGQQSVRKVRTIGDQVLCASTGAVGMSQLFNDEIVRIWPELAKSKSVEDAMKKLGLAYLTLAQPFIQGANHTRALGVDAQSAICKSLVAFSVDRKPALVVIEANGAPEHATPDLPFVAAGSGQLIADPFLAFLKRLLWVDREPTVAEGRLVAVWTIDHVRRTNAGGVGGACQLATIEQQKGKGYSASMVDDADISEHQQKVVEVEQAVRQAILDGKSAPTIVTIPPVPHLDASTPVTLRGEGFDEAAASRPVS